MPLALPPTPAAESSAAAAVEVVRAYYRAISARDYRRAYALWHDSHSYASFVKGYAHTKWVKLSVFQPIDIEGGAGSSYATVKVKLDAGLDSGRVQHFRGNYTLRRVNDVDGSTAAQRRWHIEGASLRPAP